MKGFFAAEIKLALCAVLALLCAAPARADDSAQLYKPYDPGADDAVVVLSGMYGEYDPGANDAPSPDDTLPVPQAAAAKPAAMRMAKTPAPVRYPAAHIHGTPKAMYNFPGTIVAQGVFAGRPADASGKQNTRAAANKNIKKPAVGKKPAAPESVLPPPKADVNVPISATPCAPAGNEAKAPGNANGDAAKVSDSLNRIIAAHDIKSVSDFCDYSAIPNRTGGGFPRGFILMPGAPAMMDCRKK